ncbi:MAG: hypothetical protein JWL79_2363 [Frankiales bacterium]|nr:hypothetical protein [Frankiales bacterium]
MVDLDELLAPAVELDRPTHQPAFELLQARSRRLRRQRRVIALAAALAVGGATVTVITVITVIGGTAGTGGTGGSRLVVPSTQERAGAVLAFTSGGGGNAATMYRNHLLTLRNYGSSCPAKPVQVTAQDSTHVTVRYQAPRRGACFTLLAPYTAYLQLPPMIDLTSQLTVVQLLPDLPRGAVSTTVEVPPADNGARPPSPLPCQPSIRNDRLDQPFRFDGGQDLQPDPASPSRTAAEALASFARIQGARRQPVTGHERAIWARYSDGHRITNKAAWVIYTPGALRQDSYSLVEQGLDFVVVLHDRTLHAIDFFSGRSSYC